MVFTRSMVNGGRYLVSIYLLMPTLSTSFIAISAILVAFGWRLAIKRKLESHKKVMLAASIAALIFFIIYSSRTILVGNTTWGGPDDLKVFYMAFLIFHIILATVAAVFGITTLTLAFRSRFAKHRKWGRVTSVIWFFTAITGIAVYVLPMINAILG
jgi:putative membrane protein